METLMPARGKFQAGITFRKVAMCNKKHPVIRAYE
jgi:hypothetical protein